MSLPSNETAKPTTRNWADRFLAGVQSTEPVSGYTHNYYSYPARFSPQFARAAIKAFSKPGDVILDPFMGGATTLVEALALGRHTIGGDINSLAVFLASVKTTPLSDNDLKQIEDWVCGLSEYLNLRRSSARAEWWHAAGYQRNLPWPIRKLLELALARVCELPHEHQQRFARCLLLKAGQWAVEYRKRVPSAGEFRRKLSKFMQSFVEGMREFRWAVHDNAPSGHEKAISIVVNRAAADLPSEPAFAGLPKKPTLVVTSPPYPGVYVLYHRWKVRGRKESPALFWVADCKDSHGEAHYCLGHRKQPGLTSYFDGLRDSFAGVRQVIDPSAMVVQTASFHEPDWQLPSFLEAMNSAGFQEVTPQSLGILCDGRLWRDVPGRRWVALIQGDLSTSKELVLFHRPR